jgi:UDP-N-acetylmuramate dehydrogenase
MLFAFDIFDWLVIKISNYKIDTNHKFISYKWIRWNIINVNFNYENDILHVWAEQKISDIAEILYRENINKLWMRFIWLPWTIAGAVVGNAGCFGLETENNFLKANVLNLETLQIETLSKQDMNFSYRNSILKQTWKYLLLDAYFDLSKKIEKYDSWKQFEDIIYFREEVQPKWNTCWSFFANPSREYPAGMLIEKVWLKWYKLNWAYFSSKHANFLMSDGTATWQDLIFLKELAQNKVKEQFWLDLIPEVRIIRN